MIKKNLFHIEYTTVFLSIVVTIDNVILTLILSDSFLK